VGVLKELQFPVSVRWRGGRLTRAESRDKGIAEDRGLVAQALDVPVHVAVAVTATTRTPAAATR
jgi:hypothetical protein